MSARRTEEAHLLLAQVLGPGDLAIDATAGNGHDTVFLARNVGPTGKVFAFDIQACALAATRDALVRADGALVSRVELIHDSHAHMASRLGGDASGRVSAIMFNLGYLPGGDKHLTTQPDTTLAAIHAGAALLRRGGMMTVIGYLGHDGGRLEVREIENLMDGVSPLTWRECVPGSPSPIAPRLFIGIRDSVRAG